MWTRREFLGAASGAVGLSAIGVQSAEYDLVVKGGRVIDPANHVDRIADVAIHGGRVAAVKSGIASSKAAEVVDAAGKIVTPGLIDIHVHAAESGMTPAFCLSTGTTAMVDAGSRGADNVEGIVSAARAAPNRTRIFLNVARRGVQQEGELQNIENADVAAARTAIEAHRDLIVGVKVRLSRSVAGDRDLEALRRAREVASSFGFPVMLHIGQTASPVPAILAMLKPGDIVTHVYSPPPNAIFDESGRILHEVLAARRRGIRFDIGNGRLFHITWDTAERAIRQGFLPDTISSDLTTAGRTDRVFDFPTVLSKFLSLGMSLEQVVACATVNAARAIPPFKELGTLRVGALADLAVFDLREGDFEFVDNEYNKRIGHQKLVPVAVVSGGRRVALA